MKTAINIVKTLNEIGATLIVITYSEVASNRD